VASGLYVPLRKLRPDLAEDLLALVAQAMAPLPRERFATVEDLLAAVQPLCDAPGRPLDPQPSEDPESGSAAEETTFVGLRPMPMGDERTAPPETTFVGRAPARDPVPTDWTKDPRTLWRALTATGVLALAALLALVVSLTAEPSPTTASVTQARAAQGGGGPGPAEGVLEIETLAGTEIQINDQSIGETPGVGAVWLTAGQHRLRLIRPGYRVHEERLTIVPGQTVRRAVELLPSR
jgi:hypothetical protein